MPLERVFLLYRNDPGEPGIVIGLFSNPSKAIAYSKQAPTVNLPGTWRPHPNLNNVWINKHSERITATYYSVELALVDELIERDQIEG